MYKLFLSLRYLRTRYIALASIISVTLGVAWKPLANAILKIDYQDVSNEADSGVDQFNVAVGWLF